MNKQDNSGEVFALVFVAVLMYFAIRYLADAIRAEAYVYTPKTSEEIEQARATADAKNREYVKGIVIEALTEHAAGGAAVAE